MAKAEMGDAVLTGEHIIPYKITGGQTRRGQGTGLTDVDNLTLAVYIFEGDKSFRQDPVPFELVTHLFSGYGYI